MVTAIGAVIHCSRLSVILSNGSEFQFHCEELVCVTASTTDSTHSVTGEQYPSLFKFGSTYIYGDFFLNHLLQP